MNKQKAPYMKLHNGETPNLGDIVYTVNYSDLRSISKTIVNGQNNTTYSEHFKTKEEAEQFIVSQIGVQGFMIGTEFFSGDLQRLMAHYIHQNPSKPWRIWLIDNGHRV